mgnify:CR=1 FL=1
MPAPLLTVIVPSYNSQDYLDRAMTSLVGYGDEVEVIIVDDGSKDATGGIADDWASRYGSVRVIHQENKGHGGAVNAGVAAAAGTHVRVVDSDDWLLPGAIEHVLAVWATIAGDDRYAGIVALRGTDDHTPMGTWMPAGVTEVKMWDLLEKYRFKGDTSLIHRTDVLRDHPYEVAPGETFVSEASVFFLLDEEYWMRTDNTILTICHYLPDGLTRNFAANAKRNPIGYWKHKRYCAQRSTTLKGIVRETLLYLVGCRLAGQRGAIAMAPHKVVAAACYLPALVARHTVFR